LRFLKAFGKFWYDFIIGDDWKIAAAVVSAIIVVYALAAGKVLGDHALTVTGGVIVVVFFTISLAIDVRPGKK
jgi:hypothetical protein